MRNETLISEIESLIRRDPARRGLIGADGNGPGKGELIRAARLFAPGNRITGVGILTGFLVPDTLPEGPIQSSAPPKNRRQCGNAETDGPPGAAVLSDILMNLGVPATVFTDDLCLPVVQSACDFGTSSTPSVLTSPNDHQQSTDWRSKIFQESSIQQISHFIAIERVGPAYFPDSTSAGEAIRAQQLTEESPNWRPGHCCNMRGESIDAHSANLHLLIDSALTGNPNVKVIGIGDGGNEIGMGRFSRDELLSRITGPHAERIPCRITADATIVAGISNWGAYALAAAIAIQHDQVDLLATHTADSQLRLLEHIVSEAGAVDGVTRRNDLTVDGLPFLTQIQPWIAIRERLGLRP